MLSAMPATAGGSGAIGLDCAIPQTANNISSKAAIKKQCTGGTSVERSPWPGYTPVSRAIPSAAPGNSVTPPVNERSTHSAARSHERTAAAKRRLVHHQGRRPRVARPAPEFYSSYYPPFGYNYGCARQPAWDGYWFRTSPCLWRAADAAKDTADRRGLPERLRQS